MLIEVRIHANIGIAAYESLRRYKNIINYFCYNVKNQHVGLSVFHKIARSLYMQIFMEMD